MQLFFYGVLREGVGDWPFLTGLGLGSPATATGALYAIPEGEAYYPALIETQARFSSPVHGTLHEAGPDFGDVNLAAIDAFEGADYERRSLAIDGWDGFGKTTAQVYVWTADLPEGAELIAHGDFVRWLAETGNRAFSQADQDR